MSAVARDASRPSRVTGPALSPACVTGVTGALPFFSVTGDDASRIAPVIAIAAGQTALPGVGDRCDGFPRDVEPMRAGGGKPAEPADPSPVIRRRPPWLYDGPLTDRARLTGCTRCHRAVLEALADGVMPAHVDLAHLTPAQELEHLLAGRMTLRLWPDPPTSDVRRLAFRSALDIRARPGRGLPVHDCAVVRRPDPTLLSHRRPAAWTEEPTW